MTPNDVVSIAANYGVAIFLAIYFAWWITSRMEAKLDKLVQKIEELIRLQQEFQKIVIDWILKREKHK